MASYAVIWREGSGPAYAGRLELGHAALCLRGSSPDGGRGRRSVLYRDVSAVRIARSPSERINGSPVVVLDRRAAVPVSIAVVSVVGVALELADSLADLIASDDAAATPAPAGEERRACESGAPHGAEPARRRRRLQVVQSHT